MSACRGFLKQQSADAGGLFCWARRFFELDLEAGLLRSFRAEGDAAPLEELDVRGVKGAREWKVCSPSAGYGFDVSWASGRLWSFLAADKAECAAWVQAFSLAAQGMSAPADETVLPAQSPLGAPYAEAPRTVDRMRPLTYAEHSPDEQSALEQSGGAGDSEFIADGYRGAADSSMLSGALQREVVALRRLVGELQVDRAYQTRLAEETLRTARREHEADLQAAREEAGRGREDEVAAAEGLHSRLAGMQRALDRLHEDLAAERKKNALLEERAESRASVSAARERAVRGELAQLGSKLESAEEALRQTTSEQASIRARHEKELARAGAEAEQRASLLMRDCESLRASRESYARERVDEATRRADVLRATAIEEARAAVKRELEGVHVKELALLQSRCAGDVAGALAEERRSRDRQVEGVKAVFVQRERETAEDLRRLEELHAAKALRLETQLGEAREKEQAAVAALAKQRQSESRAAAQLLQSADADQLSARECVARAEALSAQLSEQQRVLQESRAREHSYREQLTQALESSRTLRYEAAELKRQAADGSGHSQQWRRAVREAELARAATEASLQIANDEIAMLDNEMRRLQENNASLQQTINRADKIMYGSSRRPAAKENAGLGSRAFVAGSKSISIASPLKQVSPNKLRRAEPRML